MLECILARVDDHHAGACGALGIFQIRAQVDFQAGSGQGSGAASRLNFADTVG